MVDEPDTSRRYWIRLHYQEIVQFQRIENISNAIHPDRNADPFVNCLNSKIMLTKLTIFQGKPRAKHIF